MCHLHAAFSGRRFWAGSIEEALGFANISHVPSNSDARNTAILSGALTSLKWRKATKDQEAIIQKGSGRAGAMSQSITEHTMKPHSL